ncbi:splicing factor, proline- and glutamine-rich-like [Balaenoptera musculus]|uniref:Splicing factor, proline- and glutamine-rich-like n=1 Tax=Balaenoptera musculus TaxID=9771 RepID=A0A8B8W6V8_BALMU|nr:splicing factor, proline- and glutamine-rich-like [Balaenoptera musculus]
MTPEQRLGAASPHGHSSPRTGFKAQSTRPLKGSLGLLGGGGGVQRTRATRGELPPAVTAVAWEHPGHGARGPQPVREVGPAPQHMEQKLLPYRKNPEKPMHRLQQNPNHLHFSLNKAQLWGCPGPAPAPSLTVAPPPGAELWVLSVHTLRVPRTLWGETGPRPPFPWKEGQVPGHLTSSTYSPPPPTIMHAPAGPAFLETQVTLKNSVFSMCLLLLQGLGAPPDPPSCGPGPGPNPTCPGAQSSSTRSSLWDGVSALPPPSVDFSALLSSPGNPLQPPPCISPSSNFGQSEDARSPGAHGGLRAGGHGICKNMGSPQAAPALPYGPLAAPACESPVS